MSLTQSRKQRILQDVKRRRRQRAIASIAIGVGLIVIIVVAVIFLRGPPNPVNLPDYLSHCVGAGPLIYHSHPNLTVTINGAHILLPPGPNGAGTFNQGCPQPLHTHDQTGVIHVETDENRDYTLSDWFLLWGYYLANPNYAILNSTQIFTYKTDSTHHLTMTVNGATSAEFGSHVFPRNASPTDGTGGTGLCVVPTGQPCVRDNIVIVYG